jgi:hypothetical protein
MDGRQGEMGIKDEPSSPSVVLFFFPPQLHQPIQSPTLAPDFGRPFFQNNYPTITKLYAF